MLVKYSLLVKMASEVVYVDALPYFDQGYDEPGVREAVYLFAFFAGLV